MENLFGIPEKTRRERLIKSRRDTTDLTKDVIEWLNATQQFKVHRSNNFPSQRITRKPVIVNAFDSTGKPIEIKYDQVEIHFKKNNIKEKILDISGFVLPYNGNDSIAGHHIELEVKTKKDTLSEGQIERIHQVKRAGGISFVFDTMETFLLQIKPFIVEKKLAF